MCSTRSEPLNHKTTAPSNHLNNHRRRWGKSSSARSSWSSPTHPSSPPTNRRSLSRLKLDPRPIHNINCNKHYSTNSEKEDLVTQLKTLKDQMALMEKLQNKQFFEATFNPLQSHPHNPTPTNTVNKSEKFPLITKKQSYASQHQRRFKGSDGIQSSPKQIMNDYRKWYINQNILLQREKKKPSSYEVRVFPDNPHIS